MGRGWSIACSWRIDFRCKGEISDIKERVQSLTANGGRHGAVW